MKSCFAILFVFCSKKDFMQIRENNQSRICYCYLRVECISEYQNLCLSKIISFKMQAEYCTNHWVYILNL